MFYNKVNYTCGSVRNITRFKENSRNVLPPLHLVELTAKLIVNQTNYIKNSVVMIKRYTVNQFGLL